MEKLCKLGVRMQIAPYPWKSLERLGRDAIRAATDARRTVARSIRVEGLESALGSLLTCDTRLLVQRIAIDRMPAPAGRIVCVGSGARVTLEVDPELAASSLGRLLGRPVSLGVPGTPLDATLRGALAALFVEVARRSGGTEAITVESEPAHAGGAPIVRVDAHVLLDEKPYTARAFVELVSPPPPIETTLDMLGSLPISLPLTIGLSLAERNELASLERGDAWLAGDGLWIDRAGAGRGVLAASGSERGQAVDLAPDGSIVVGDDSVVLELELGENGGFSEGSNMSSAKQDGSNSLAEAALEAPVVVRIELGTVSMTAREWGALRPGDVIESGRRVSEPVVLRVAGREVARGELVDVEGEVGVRVREILTSGASS